MSETASEPIDLATRTWGAGQQRALLIHGLSSSSASWWRVGQDLADFGYTVVAPDLRGHGATGHIDKTDGSIAAFTADVRNLGGGWDLALGHSLGGRILLDCQVADAAFANVVVLVDPGLALSADPGYLDELNSEYDTDLTPGAFAARYPLWTDRDIEGKLEALSQSSSEVSAATLSALAEGDRWHRLAQVTVPTLVMGAHPDNGGFVPDEVGASIAEQPNVTYAAFADAGHSIHRDAYEEFWDVLVRFVRRNSTSR